jgi:ABC-type branched-subunit amino acid transport system substrate-binding protein
MKNILKLFTTLGMTLSLSLGSTFASFAEDGVNDTELKIGMVTAMTGKTSFLGISFREGIVAYINKLNESGGINGRKINLITKDDKYEPDQTLVESYKLIKKEKVFAFLGHMGTPTTTALRPLLKKEKVPLFATFSGGERIRNPITKEIFHYRASYIQEAESAVAGVVDKMKFKKIGVFYQNDSFGKTSLRGVDEALKRRGLKISVKSFYKRNTTDINEGLNTILKTKPDVVFTMATYQAASKFITEAKKRHYNPLFICNSGVGTGRLLELLGGNGNGVIVTQVVPLINSDLPAVKEYKAELTKSFPSSKPNSVSLEGYISAKVFFEGVKKMGKNVTRDDLIKSIESIKNLDVGIGSEVSYSEKNHQGSQTIYNTYIDKGDYKLIYDWNDFKNIK